MGIEAFAFMVHVNRIFFHRAYYPQLQSIDWYVLTDPFHVSLPCAYLFKYF